MTTDPKALRGLLENRHPPYEYCGAYRCNVTGIGHVEMRNNYCDLWSEKQLLQVINALPDLLDAYEERDRLKAENKKLREIAEGAAKVNLIDAEDKDGKVIFSMSMEGEQLFNPPQFVRLAKEYVADRNLLKGGE